MEDSALVVSLLPTGAPEIFASIQGEGASLGTPSTFIRLAGCNLRCSWCDTPYTWNWTRFDVRRRTVSMPISEVIEAMSRHDAENTVITGGEPLLQIAALTGLVSELRSLGRRIEIETNGTIVPTAALIDQVDQWNVSPKLQNSGESPETRIRPTAMKRFAQSDRTWFKFVVCAVSDLAEVDALAAEYGIDSARVILMPEGTTPDVLLDRARWFAEPAADRGYRLTTRLHILLWGNTPGR